MYHHYISVDKFLIKTCMCFISFKCDLTYSEGGIVVMVVNMQYILSLFLLEVLFFMYTAGRMWMVKRSVLNEIINHIPSPAFLLCLGTHSIA